MKEANPVKNILVISHYYPPSQAPESVMTNKLASRLSMLGHNVCILAGKHAGCERNDETLKVHDGVKVYRCRSIRNLLIDQLATRRFIPDAEVTWIPFAERESKKIIRAEHIDVILSRSMPVSDHLLGLRLKKSTGLPWIASFSDPWTQNPYNTYPPGPFRKINEWLEGKIAMNADRITFTCSQAKDRFLERYPSCRGKVSVIPNFFDPDEFEGIGRETEKQDTFTMVHTGSLYGIRSPEPLFKAVQAFGKSNDIAEKLQVVLVGYLAAKYRTLIKDYGLDATIRIIDTVPRKEAIAWLYRADVLLTIDAPDKGPSMFLPSKLVDYIYMGKPILGITPEGGSADAIRLTRTGIVVHPEDTEGIEDGIARFYEDYRNGTLRIEPDHENIEKFSVGHCAGLMTSLIEEVM